MRGRRLCESCWDSGRRRGQWGGVWHHWGAMVNDGTCSGDQVLLAYASGGEVVAGRAGPGPGECFRQGAALIAAEGAILPVRCVLCGGEGVGAGMRLTFSWDGSFRFTRISRLQMGRKAAIVVSLCGEHRRRVSRGKWIGTLGVMAGTAAMIVGISIAAISENAPIPIYEMDGIGIILAGFGVVICFLFVYAISTRTLSCDRIEGGYLYLQGASPGFLETLAELPERSAARYRAARG